MQLFVLFIDSNTCRVLLSIKSIKSCISFVTYMIFNAVLVWQHKSQNITSKKTFTDATQRHSDLKLVGCLGVTLLCIQNGFFR